MSSFFRTVGSDSDSDSSDEELLSDGSEGSETGLEAKKPTAPLKNRFLKGGSDSDDSDSDDDSDDMDESDSDDDQRRTATAGAGTKANRFLVGAESETDTDTDDEGRRVVKSAKSKRQDEIDASVKIMENGSKINDWVVISNEFDKLTRLVQRSSSVAEPLPVAYIKIIISLEESQTAANENAATKKKMNATNAKAFNTMKQKLKKASREHEEILGKYKADPEAFEAEAAALDAPLPEKKVKKSKSAEADGEEDDGDDFTMVGKGGKSFSFSPDSIFKTLQSVLEARGKKNTDRAEQLMILEKLLSISTTTYQRIRVLLALVSSQLDYNPSTTTHMPPESWKAARSKLDELLTLLDAETRFVVKEATVDYDDQEERAPDDADSAAKLEVRGSIGSLLDRLDDEFTKSLQNIDPHTSEYIERLKDEKDLYCTIFRAQSYFERIEHAEAVSKAVMRRLEHIYCKPDAVIEPLEAALPDVPSQVSPRKVKTEDASPYSSSELIHTLCAYLYKTENSLLRTRAALCQIFNYGLHDEYYRARDLLLMLHLQETVNAADVGTQIMFNRTIVQLGLAAFRLGLIKESQSILQDIFASQRVKELLAQGVQAQRYSQLTPEQEKIERQRQLPFHMHINLELLECAYLVSSMLLEIPNLAQAGNDPELKKRQISRTFRRMFEYAERQAFIGPPENKRDHIMQASKALQTGDWQKCVELINGIKIWSLMPRQEALKEMLTRKIQEEALRTYLFTYSAYYSTISLEYLSTTFQLNQATVTSIVSRMIWNDELSGASLDQIGKVLVLAKQELTKLQQLTIGLIDKVNGMAETNDRYLETKIGADRDGANRGGGGGGERKDGEVQRGPRRGGGAKNYRGRGGRGAFSGPIGGRAVAAGGSARRA